ncbi:hypothetical protein NPIL_458691 [Nephila pilipes]|uniref:Uncharacterized protein n=1 Tax=Nephila pilipes TaxID=299642 RepID=A0A8X6UM04_NEPPI|nr:hypothetical protein NPIL_458691 [Nephila pilipes]
MNLIISDPFQQNCQRTPCCEHDLAGQFIEPLVKQLMLSSTSMVQRSTKLSHSIGTSNMESDDRHFTLPIPTMTRLCLEKAQEA